MAKTLLLICPHFAPDTHAATGEVMTKLVHSLADRNYQTTVVTALPWYKDHKVAEGWGGRLWRSEDTEWGRVVRVWPFATSKTSIAARAVGFAALTKLATVKAVTQPTHDVVMAMSPPIFLAEAGWVAAKRFKAPFVFNVQDIFPDVAVDLGALTNPKAIKLARRYEKAIYKRADAITVVSDDQAVNVKGKLKTRHGKVKVVSNFVDTVRIKPVSKFGPYRKKHGIDANKTVIMYSGNVGLSQSFELIKYAAERRSEDPSLLFVINGEGASRPSVDAWAKSLPNVMVADFAPRSEVSHVLGAADIGLILLKSGLAKSSTPSKMYTLLAAGRPILASIDPNSEVADIVTTAKAGLCVPPDDPEAFDGALSRMLENPKKLSAMGVNARAYTDQLVTPHEQAKRYDELFQELIDRKANN